MRISKPLMATVAACTLMFASQANALTLLGTGTGALRDGKPGPGLGHADLTDPGGQGNEGVYDLHTGGTNDGGFRGVFFSSNEQGFGGGEFAFNVFDNQVGGGNAKWCCGAGAGNPITPQIVGVNLPASHVINSFTVTSGNDTVTRDPRVWRLEGSNDGFASATTIHSVNNPGAGVWTARNQVALFEAGVDYAAPGAFNSFRLVTEATGANAGAFFQLNEIELFDDAFSASFIPPPPPPPVFNNLQLNVTGGNGSNDNDINDTGEAIGILEAGRNLLAPAVINANGKIYNVSTVARNTTDRVDFAGGGGNFPGGDPYPNGATGTGQTDFLVASQTFGLFPAGTYTIAAGSDDGRILQIEDLTNGGFVFTAAGDQINLGGAGQDFIGFNNPTGQNQTVGTFILTEETILDIEGMFWERGGGDQFEISIALGQQGAFNGNFVLLEDGVFDIDLALTKKELTVPEPTTAILGLLGMVGMGLRRRRAA